MCGEDLSSVHWNLTVWFPPSHLQGNNFLVEMSENTILTKGWREKENQNPDQMVPSAPYLQYA